MFDSLCMVAANKRTDAVVLADVSDWERRAVRWRHFGGAEFSAVEQHCRTLFGIVRWEGLPRKHALLSSHYDGWDDYDGRTASTTLSTHSLSLSYSPPCLGYTSQLTPEAACASARAAAAIGRARCGGSSQQLRQRFHILNLRKLGS